MKNFKDFGIKPTQQTLTGDKIKMDRILNRQIKVCDFRLENSKFEGKCLYLQIELNNNKHVVFTGSAVLMEQIQQVPSDGFPFTTTIVRENERFEFT